MKEYLLNILPRLKAYSKDVEIAENLIDKPWVWMNDEHSKEKLIFRRGGILLMIRNGIVNEGKWDLISSMNSILIDRGADKLLMNYAFVDKAIILLKRDGVDNDIIAFVNEVEIPNLDYSQYFNTLVENEKPPMLAKSLHEKLNFELANESGVFKVYIDCENDLSQQDAYLYAMNWAEHQQKPILIQSTGKVIADGFYKIPERHWNDPNYYNNVYFVEFGKVVGRYKPQPIYRTLSGKQVTIYQNHPTSWNEKQWSPGSIKYSLVFYRNTLRRLETGKYPTSMIESFTIVDGVIVKDGWF